MAVKSDIKVNFLLVGAAKSGTSTLIDGLEQHPNIFVSAMKEPHFFSKTSMLIQSKKDYLALFDGHNKEKMIGEASSSYLFVAGCEKEIYNELGKIKIIIILRNPVERAYSNWFHMRQHESIENLPFNQALEVEEKRLQNKEKFDYWPGLMYFRTGLYYSQVNRYIKQFGEENVKIIIFEEFIENPRNHWKQIYQFLEVDFAFVPLQERINQAHEPRFKFLYNFISPPPKFLLNIYNIFPSKFKILIYRIISKIHRSNRKLLIDKPKIDLEVKLKLKKLYKEDTRLLEKLLGYEIISWRK